LGTEKKKNGEAEWIEIGKDQGVPPGIPSANTLLKGKPDGRQNLKRNRSNTKRARNEVGGSWADVRLEKKIQNQGGKARPETILTGTPCPTSVQRSRVNERGKASRHRGLKPWTSGGAPGKQKDASGGEAKWGGKKKNGAPRTARRRHARYHIGKNQKTKHGPTSKPWKRKQAQY